MFIEHLDLRSARYLSQSTALPLGFKFNTDIWHSVMTLLKDMCFNVQTTSGLAVSGPPLWVMHKAYQLLRWLCDSLYIRC